MAKLMIGSFGTLAAIASREFQAGSDPGRDTNLRHPTWNAGRCNGYTRPYPSKRAAAFLIGPGESCGIDAWVWRATACCYRLEEAKAAMQRYTKELTEATVHDDSLWTRVSGIYT